MDRQSRADHVRLLMRQQRNVNGARARYAECVGDAIIAAANGSDVWTPAIAKAAGIGVHRCQDEFYGATRGDERSTLRAAILDSTAAAYTLAVSRGREIAEAALADEPVVLRELKRYGRRGNG